MSNQRRDNQPSAVAAEHVLLFTGLAIVLIGGGVLYAIAHLGHRLDGAGITVPANPWDVLFGMVVGDDLPWPESTPLVATASGAVVLILVVAITWAVVRRRGRRSSVGQSAQLMGTGGDLEALTAKGAGKRAEQFGMDRERPGVPIGHTVTTDQMLYGSWEDMHIDIWGPRTGKTTARAIPAILEAPGACIVTSNKRDVVDATRGPRSVHGPVWVFDPQQVATEPADWWWDPLSYVTNEVKAQQLADHFAASSRSADARTDAYFDSAGQDLLAGLLLAAACDARPITQVYTWLTQPTDVEPADILARYDYPQIADNVAAVVDAPDKQRGGVYGTAQQMANCLTSQSVLRWVTDPDGDRPHLDVGQLLDRGGTIYALSREGRGTAGPLVTALTVAIVEHAEEQAAFHRGGRLSTPLVGVLDEAANVCRWRDLPDLYSHFGSRGIVLMTILQSWSQGVQVWGREGMRKLWSSANIKVYGGGVAETEFLNELSQLIGEYDRSTTSVSSGWRQGRSVSQQTSRQRILDVADLGALPRGHAVLFASGAPATMIRPVPWMARPEEEAVKASINRYEPSGHKAKAGR